MTYNIYMVMRDGQAEVSLFLGRVDYGIAEETVTDLVRALDWLDDCPVTEIRAVDEDFNCVDVRKIGQERKDEK